MSQETDRITVPTNGKHPHPAPDGKAPAEPARTAPQPTAPFSPTQLAVGFGILAAIVALVAGSLGRRARSRHRGPLGRR
jgi:hypothetical protein